MPRPSKRDHAKIYLHDCNRYYNTCTFNSSTNAPRHIAETKPSFPSCRPQQLVAMSLDACPFCKIGEHYPPSSSPSDNHELVSPSAFVVLSTPLCMAFLDIMPLSPGHLLVTTRKHHEKISDVTEEEAKELGVWLTRLSRVLANVTGVYDWNIVQNNGL